MLFHNIYLGGRNNVDGGARTQSRKQNIAEFARQGEYDVVAMSELNDFSPASFQSYGSDMGLQHTAFLRTPYGFHLGIASRHEVEVLQSESGGRFHHGYLLAAIPHLNYAVLVTHLHPENSVARKGEAEAPSPV